MDDDPYGFTHRLERDAKKSKYYGAGLGHFEDAKACYERAGLARSWDVLVAEVRGAHRRKAGFMADFERLVAGRRPSDEPSFLERAIPDLARFASAPGPSAAR